MSVIIEFLESKQEYKVRIGFILLLSHYLKVDLDGKNISRKKVVELTDIEESDNHTLKYIDFIFQRLAKNHTEAWLLAECFVTCPKQTWDFINNKGRDTMDIYTYNKALSKICESKNPSNEVKLKIKALKKH